MKPIEVSDFFVNAHNQVNSLRMDILFGLRMATCNLRGAQPVPEDEDMTPEQIQYYLLATTALEQAQRWLCLAGMKGHPVMPEITPDPLGH